MKRVASYETTDGQLFTNRAEALTHQAIIDVCGVIQGNSLGRMTTMTVKDVARFVVNHGPELQTLLSKYKEKMRRCA